MIALGITRMPGVELESRTGGKPSHLLAKPGGLDLQQLLCQGRHLLHVEICKDADQDVDLLHVEACTEAGAAHRQSTHHHECTPQHEKKMA